MRRSQLNIKLPEELLKSVKRQAMRSGLSLTEHIVNLITSSLEDDGIEKSEQESILVLRELSERVSIVESAIKNSNYLNIELTPFTDQEAINCTNFMRGVFNKTIEIKGFKSKKQAFSDFCRHLTHYPSLNEFSVLRLKEVMLMDDPDPWTGKELNDLSEGDKCKCPIRFGLINWTGKNNVPSQQEICDKGEALLNSF